MVATPGGIILEEEQLGGFGGFPDKLFLVSMGGGKYAANNATAPDGTVLDGLACFPTEEDGNTYMGLLGGLSGELEASTFENARQIAQGKPKLNCLLLFVAGKIVEYHFIR